MTFLVEQILQLKPDAIFAVLNPDPRIALAIDVVVANAHPKRIIKRPVYPRLD
jgi:hypothetical protein